MMKCLSINLFSLLALLLLAMTSAGAPTAKALAPAETNLAAAAASVPAPTEAPDAAAATDDIPAFVPIVTAAPNNDAALASQGFVQVTYYTCMTRGGEESCGWHIPLIEVGEGTRPQSVSSWWIVGLVTAVFVFGLA